MFVEAQPDAGFNYPYYLATPAAFREPPVPLLVEMNNGQQGVPFEEERQRAESQVTNLGYQGAWLSEELGVPHLKPVFPEPDGDPVDKTHQVALLDRETMLLEETDLRRVDLQLLGMADHARRSRLTDRSMHEQVMFYGNSSEGVVAERMAAMHPEEVLCVSPGGLNGFVLLPYEELGGNPLEYPVGVADYEALLGKPYDRAAHAAVDKFFIQGGQDPKNRLPSKDEEANPNLWNDPDVLRAAQDVYGPRPVEDRFPRCHIAFEGAGVDAQFRVYPEMTHDPRPASHDLLAFHERSIEGGDVSGFGQRLELPLDREIEVAYEDVEDATVRTQFDLTGESPPPVGLVEYDWTFGDGATGSGRPVFHQYAEPGTYAVTASMKTAHGQRSERSLEYAVDLPAFALQGAELSADAVAVGETVTLTATVENAGTADGELPVAFAVDGAVVANVTVELAPGDSTTVEFEARFEAPGPHELTVNGEPAGTVAVEPAATATPSAAASPTRTTGDAPGFGVAAALAGLGGAVGYRLRRDGDEDG